MPQQNQCNKIELKVGFLIAGIHTLIVLAMLLKILSVSDGTERWATSMLLAWTVEIWTVPLYTVLGWHWEVHSFYVLCFLGGGVIYFLMGYMGTRLVLKFK
ncbi:MAG: hypothetical protein HW412_643 [Bacteroidetes bacterium]|nr:hypothetical protein [Bacteroidota bacterium]